MDTDEELFQGRTHVKSHSHFSSTIVYTNHGNKLLVFATTLPVTASSYVNLD